ncbi:DoxX family protein [Nocardia farcinica]|uniref:DoxX family protein n=1 Tax=Nocardia farcinica TaxID=37329 RepID=UPI00189456CA|nr:DoxX family protein [Nocardia farcinica]MBF6261327.1 DoxX family protein [Nocardia farcinica]MBF6279005.1 DoxX family protein [Nocardia farcinica]MBF6304337.1 DoxX family protein [Nocardia farcinica]MBF6389378.1 DoxX family protein [Nocardia farcinica]MBF6493710.1 DoxX family protein [Nocardia farcinica]
MNLALWIAAGLLAFVALGGGVGKTFFPVEKLAAAPGGGWTTAVRPGFVRTLGGVELLAAAGLILPPLLGIAPALVPVTAACWVVLMIGAIITHVRHDGWGGFVALNVTYLVLAAFIAWGRFGPQPFAA